MIAPPARPVLFAVVSLVAGGVSLPALDWPNFRGPDFNGISREQTWTADWPAGGPRVLWRASVGLGFSTIAVADDRAVTTGHDGKKEGRDTVWCFDAATGRLLWQHTYAAPLGDKFFEGGATGTPTIHEGRIYHLSRQGDFFCLDARNGSVIWQRQIAQEDGFKAPEWGFASSPLVEGRLLILNVGDAGTAFDKETGKIVWTNGRGEAAYATVIPFDLNGKRCAAVLAHRECVVLEAATGKVLWRQEFKSNYDTNSGAPVIHEGALLLSAYNVPAVKLRLGTGQPAPGWQTDTRVHFNAGVVFDGRLYAFHGQAGKPEGELRCLDWQTGEVKWKQGGLGVGSLIGAPERKLIVLSETGELLVVEASPAGFKARARAQVLGGKCWSTPVLANGRIYARNVKGDLVCLDVSLPRQPKVLQ